MATAPTRAQILMAQNERVSTILESSEGLRNPKLARELALRSEMTAPAAIDLLRQVPQTENPYIQAMDALGPIGITGNPSTATTSLTGADPKEARRIELQGSMKSFNASKGYSRRAAR